MTTEPPNSSPPRLIPDLPITAYDDPSAVMVEKVRKPWQSSPAEQGLLTSWRNTFSEFDRLQAEIGAWATKNFKEKAGGLNPLLGMVEETGELARAVLKKDQGIRGTPEEHDSNAIDAIGDIVVYAMNHMNNNGIKAGGIILGAMASFIHHHAASSHEIPESERARMVLTLSARVSGIAMSADQGKDPKIQLEGAFLILELLSRSFGFTTLEILQKTWNIVCKRDWVEDPTGGGGHTH